jgi:hypothetical protein
VQVQGGAIDGGVLVQEPLQQTAYTSTKISRMLAESIQTPDGRHYDGFYPAHVKPVSPAYSAIQRVDSADESGSPWVG